MSLYIPVDDGSVRRTAMDMDCSFVVPAYNEEDWIVRCVRSLHRAAGAADVSYEIVVVDNNSTDRTGELAGAHRARVVFEPVNQISRARNAGADAARGEWLVFVDADSVCSPSLFRRTVNRMQNRSVVGGGARIAMDRPVPAPARWAVSFWNTLSPLFGWAAGSYLFCRREAFEAVGGFSERVYASEEIWLSRALTRYGRSRGMSFEIIEQDSIRTSARKLDQCSTLQLFAGSLLFTLFPWAVLSKTLCGWFWYERPTSNFP